MTGRGREKSLKPNQGTEPAHSCQCCFLSGLFCRRSWLPLAWDCARERIAGHILVRSDMIEGKDIVFRGQEKDARQHACRRTQPGADGLFGAGMGVFSLFFRAISCIQRSR